MVLIQVHRNIQREALAEHAPISRLVGDEALVTIVRVPRESDQDWGPVGSHVAREIHDQIGVVTRGRAQSA